jgi:spore maturation protein CgeB
VKCAATLYGWVDPDVYKRVEKIAAFESDASYLGTYSPDRQPGLERLFLDAARELSHKRFVIGGAMYPSPPSWPKNVLHFEHVAPPQHAGFYSSSPVTLNVTRASMASMGFCPSGRLFEAAACQTAVLSDWWEGLDTFFEPGEEILITSGKSDTVLALQTAPEFLERIGRRASERALACHTAEIRARRLIQLIEDPQNEQIAQEQAMVARGA